uniref:Uncharacterized protein n=1 Tax=Rhizophora mucronata TaxID=61149 RepID=A0A2P2PDX3_RHIMU
MRFHFLALKKVLQILALEMVWL